MIHNLCFSSNEGQVCWSGKCVENEAEFKAYLTGPTRSRIFDEEQHTQYEAELRAQEEASRRLLKNALGVNGERAEERNLRFMADAMELAVIDLLGEEGEVNTLRQVSADAFQLLRVLPRPESPIESAKVSLRLACLGVLGERGVDAKRVLMEAPWPALPLDSTSWGERTLATILDVWLRVIRKDGWNDLDEVQSRIVGLRQQQQNFEAEYLDRQQSTARTTAWELVVLYHISKAAELLAIFTTQGEIGGHFDVRQQLEAQFDRALIACARAELVELDTLTRLLARTAQQLVDNCIWTVTRAVNSRVTKFVHHLVSRENNNPIFEMLPPQRRTLREAGLLGSGHSAMEWLFENEHIVNGDRLACMVRDWVSGASLPDMAQEYFATKPDGSQVEPTTALTDCCKNLFGRLTQTASWGLAALQTMTFGDRFEQLPESEQQTLRNLPARVFYGVNTDEAIALRLLGVPRRAAQPLADTLGEARRLPLPQLRTHLAQTDSQVWLQALGGSGHDYFRIWKILEGID